MKTKNFFLNLYCTFVVNGKFFFYTSLSVKVLLTFYVVLRKNSVSYSFEINKLSEYMNTRGIECEIFFSIIKQKQSSTFFNIQAIPEKSSLRKSFNLLYFTWVFLCEVYILKNSYVRLSFLRCCSGIFIRLMMKF